MLFYVYRVINGRIMDKPDACYNTREAAESFTYMFIGRQYIVREG